jgi:hypothetical protein
MAYYVLCLYGAEPTGNEMYSGIFIRPQLERLLAAGVRHHTHVLVIHSIRVSLNITVPCGTTNYS